MPRTVLHDILATGVAEGASDWHIREGFNVALRLDGRLVEVDFMTSKEFLEEAIEEMTEESHRVTFDKTGDADFALQEEGVGRFRVNLHRQRGNLAMTMRHVKDEVPDVNDLGLPSVLKQIAEHTNGIVFITGTTGSGKSTTLATMIRHMNETMNRHLITVEDPIEYTFTDGSCIIEQREVGLDCISFESALIHALRQDPDVIIVGEMRNRESFETALTAAETGHLVLTTLHTKDAPQSILRILDMYPHDERESVRKSLAEALRAIVCQRLVPKATGKGVAPVNEILVNTPIVTKLIDDDQLGKLDQAIEGGGEDGMMSFNKRLLELVNDGIISEEVALRTSDNPAALKMNLKGIFLSDAGGGIIQ
ncbi:MAG: PilT/PilU family type 4a pilus ATPase [Lentisphaeria bacterium]|nr:PilT/PilU family type 4a pilus ATPase [Lentisphaeria bacterium]